MYFGLLRPGIFSRNFLKFRRKLSVEPRIDIGFRYIARSRIFKNMNKQIDESFLFSEHVQMSKCRHLKAIDVTKHELRTYNYRC